MTEKPRTLLLCKVRGAWTDTPPEGITCAEIRQFIELEPVLDLLERLGAKRGRHVPTDSPAGEAFALLREHGRLK